MLSTPNTFWGFDFPADQSKTQEQLSLDLGAYYDIDILALFDGGGIGVLDIQTADSPNGPWTTVRTYPTISTNDWRYFTDLFPDNQPDNFMVTLASMCEVSGGSVRRIHPSGCGIWRSH